MVAFNWKTMCYLLVLLPNNFDLDLHTIRKKNWNANCKTHSCQPFAFKVVIWNARRLVRTSVQCNGVNVEPEGFFNDGSLESRRSWQEGSKVEQCSCMLPVVLLVVLSTWHRFLSLCSSKLFLLVSS